MQEEKITFHVKTYYGENHLKQCLMKSKEVQLELNKRLTIKLSTKMNIVQYMVNMYTKQIE